MKFVEDIDRGFKALVQHMTRFKGGKSVRVGVQGSEAGEDRDGITNAELAAIHEFGSPGAGIPQRSFIRSAIDREKTKINKLLERAVKSAAATGSAIPGLGVAGEFAKGQMIKTINESIGIAPNSAATIKQKGSSRPLVDTGVLKASITWKVEI